MRTSLRPGPLVGAADRSTRQVDLPPGRAARRVRRGSTRGSPATSTRPTRAARWQRSPRSAPAVEIDRARRRRSAVGLDRGLRPARCRAADRRAAIDVGNAGTLIRLICRAARRPARAARSCSTATSRSARGRWAGSPTRSRRWARRSRRPRTAARRSRSRARRLRAIHYELPIASAQVKSCLLLAGLLADGPDDGPRAGRDPRPHASGCCAPPAPTSGSSASGRACRPTRSPATIGIEPAERIALPPMTRARRPLLGRLPPRRRR